MQPHDHQWQHSLCGNSSLINNSLGYSSSSSHFDLRDRSRTEDNRGLKDNSIDYSSNSSRDPSRRAECILWIIRRLMKLEESWKVHSLFQMYLLESYLILVPRILLFPLYLLHAWWET